MKWVLLVVGGLVLVVALLALIGAFLPREHCASCRARFRTGAEPLFAVLADFERYPAWRPEVKSVRWTDSVDGKRAFLEESSQGTVRYVVEESDAPRRLVLRIADDSLPYGGTWTFTLVPDADGTTLSITEDGFVKNLIFRTLARFVFGYHGTMESYLGALGKKLGEDVTVERS